MKAVNGRFASINDLGTRISVTSHSGNKDFSETVQKKIGVNSGKSAYYGIILSFENAFEQIDIVSASVYFSEFSSLECLDDDSLSLSIGFKNSVFKRN